MSQYIYFYIRHNDEFLPILSMSRSSALYQAFIDYVLYEKIRAINYATLCNVKKDLNKKIADYKKSIEKHRKENDTIAAFNNSVGEKLDAMHTNLAVIDDLQEEVDELYTALHYVYFMIMMLEEVIGKDYIYAGIEICPPTLDDVVE